MVRLKVIPFYLNESYKGNKMSTEFKTKVQDRDGNHDITLKVEDYKAAQEAGLTFPQYVATKYGKEVDTELHGDVFTQMLGHAGMFTRANHKLGIKPPTMAEVLNGSAEVSLGGAITRPDGQNALSVSGRLLFPALILEIIESELRTDNNVYANVFNRMVATTVSTSTPRYDQPIINVTGPQGSKSSPIAQGAEPKRMISITLADRTLRMPVNSIGLSITDEAQRASTLDLVGIVVREQALQERADQIDIDIANIATGNLDGGPDGDAALAVTSFKTAYDTTAGVNALTQKGWVKLLRADWKKMNIDWIITDIDGYLAIEGRAGRPVVVNDNTLNAGLNSLPAAANPGIPDMVNVFIVDDVTILGGSNRMLCLDSTKAIRKVIYVGAAYEAIQDFVMRRTTEMRFDWSERHERLGFDQAFKMIDYSNP